MNKKRNTLKKVAGVSAVVALAPSSWIKPVVSSVVLPAHAQTSGTSTPQITPIVTLDINDDAGTLVNIATITGTEILAGAVFSIVTPITGLSVNASSGVLSYQNNVNGNQTFDVTVQVVNLDGGQDSDTFTLNVADTF